MYNDVISAYVGLEMFRSIVGFFILALGFYVICWIYKTSITPSKSGAARQFAVDLYVIGKIRKMASQEGINFEEEVLELRKIERLEKRSKIKDLDDAIENDLIEKVQDSTDKVLDKKK